MERQWVRERDIVDDDWRCITDGGLISRFPASKIPQREGGRDEFYIKMLVMGTMTVEMKCNAPIFYVDYQMTANCTAERLSLDRSNLMSIQPYRRRLLVQVYREVSGLC